MLALMCGLPAAIAFADGCSDRSDALLGARPGGSVDKATDASASPDPSPDAASHDGAADAKPSAPGEGIEAGSDANVNVVIDPTMLAFWRFEDAPASYMAKDVSGHLPPAGLAGDAVFLPGKIGNALHVDGDGWVNAGAIRATPDAGASDAGTAGDAGDAGDAEAGAGASDWTIALWVRPDDFAPGRTVLDMNFALATGDAGTALKGPRIVESAQGVAVEVGGVTIAIASALPIGEWHHVVATWTNRTLVGYFDGAQKVSSTSDAPPMHFDDIQLGRGTEDLPSARFRGALDEVRVYGRALGGAEIKEIFDGKR